MIMPDADGGIDARPKKRNRMLLNAFKLSISGAIFYYIFSR